MTEFPVPLDNLIAYVKTLHPEGEPLDSVTDACWPRSSSPYGNAARPAEHAG